MMSDDPQVLDGTITIPDSKWAPPRGAVTVTPDPSRVLRVGVRGSVDPVSSFKVDCATCGFHYPSPEYSSTRTDADQQKQWHRCPAGTIGAFPTCPVCKSTGKACRNLLGNPQSAWHEPRIQVWADAVGDQP